MSQCLDGTGLLSELQMASKKLVVICVVIACGALGISTFFLVRHSQSVNGHDEPHHSSTNSSTNSSNTTSPTSTSAPDQGCLQANGVSHCTIQSTVKSPLSSLRRTIPVTTPKMKPPGVLNACGDNRYVALTFDDGPFSSVNLVDGNPATSHVLDELKAAGFKATFFISPGGQQGHYGPADCEVLKRAVNEGHEIQFHTWSHADLTDPASNVQAEIQRSRDWINNDCVLRASPGSFTMLRPPFGYTNANVNKQINDLGLTSILWNVDSDDWKGITMEQIQNNIATQSTQPSAVILMHDKWYHSGLIAWIKQRFAGYQFVTASACYRDCGSEVC